LASWKSCRWLRDNLIADCRLQIAGFGYKKMIKSLKKYWPNYAFTFITIFIALIYGRNKNEERLSRPLSYLSFALNYHIGGTNVFGYHVVNFAIHYIAAIFLFLLLYNTLLLPILKECYKTTAYPVALVCVFLWAIHPIQQEQQTIQTKGFPFLYYAVLPLYVHLRARKMPQCCL
jgi:hypothetical protein